ncbi:UNVERIFIED_CONTAM: hypothetical protein RMT77_017334 [Armadillidium vulgare]
MAKSSTKDSVSYPSCFVCGFKKTGAHPLYIRQSGQPGPYFPFLETHEPPDGAELPTQCGKILACYACHAFLIQQWESYEKSKVPLIKRIYWLKRVDNGPYTGVEMGMQSEYASQVFGLNTDSAQGQIEVKKNSLYPDTDYSVRNSLTSPSLSTDGITTCSTPPAFEVKKPIQEEALDLSLERPTRKRKLTPSNAGEFEVKHVSDVNPSEVLDLSMPDKNAAVEVCYLCGSKFEKGTLSDIFARNFDKHSPFFPRLVMHPRPSGSKPIEASGKVLGCKNCLSFLLTQWKTFENLKIPYQLRKYEFQKENSTMQTFVCYKCGKAKSLTSLHLICVEENFENKTLHPQIKSVSARPGSFPGTHNGDAIVCTDCFNILELEKQNFSRSMSCDSGISYLKEESYQKFDNSSISVDSASPSQSKIKFIVGGETEVGIDFISCCLCHQNYSLKQMQTLSMVPDPLNSKEMYFPFLKFLPQVNQNMITEDGRILACKACHSHLTSQWLEYEKDNIPSDQRHFSLRALSVTSQSPRLTPQAHSSPSTPTELLIPQSSATQNILHCDDKILNMRTSEGYQGLSLKELEVVAVTSDNSLTLPAITTQRALNISINCYICGFHSKAGQTYSIKSKASGKEMFFPFLNKHVSAYPEAAVDDSAYLVCLICFHSLVLQWQHYEKGRIEYYARFYDTYNFTCYICSTKTYRRRLYLLPVKDYPFLKEHTCPTAGMVVNNGHSVVVCKDCFVSLNEQYTALERLGVPVEKRQYNWIQRPPPPDLVESYKANKTRSKSLGQVINVDPLISQHQKLSASQKFPQTASSSGTDSKDVSCSSFQGTKDKGAPKGNSEMFINMDSFDNKNMEYLKTLSSAEEKISG